MAIQLSIRLRRRASLVLLAVATAACDEILHTPERDASEIDRAEILQLTRVGGDQPLPADGVSQDTVEARIPKDASTQIVKFSLSRGRFLYGPGKTEMEVRAEPSRDRHDSRLVARAVIVADTLPGEAVVSASIGGFTEYLFVPFVR